MGDLSVDTAVVGSNGSYTATLSSDWHIWGPCGGYVAAVAMRAIGAHTELRRPASFTCHYLGVGEYRDVEIDVRTLRRTKRAESIELSMTQDGKPILEAVAWVVGETEGLQHEFATPPDVPHASTLTPIEDLLPPEEKDKKFYSFWSNIDERPIEWVERDEWEKRPGGDPVWRHWIRYRPTASFDDPFIDAGRLLISLDVCMWPAAARAYSFGELTHIAPSLDLSAVFHHIDPSSEWLLIDGYSPTARDGLVAGEARVWSEHNQLLCAGVQSMLCRPAPVP